MSMSREESKLRAVLRAQLGLKQALERVDYAHDVVAPRVAELKAAAQEGEVVLEIGTPEEELADADLD